MAIDFGCEVTEEQIVDRRNRAFAQDKWIVDSQPPANPRGLDPGTGPG